MKSALLCCVFLFPLQLGGVTHPLYFEQRSRQVLETHIGRERVTIRPNAICYPDVTLRFVNASPSARVEGTGTPAPATYIRAHESHAFPQFPSARIRNLQPGLDASIYGTPGRIEYDLHLTPHFQTRNIRLAIEGALATSIDADGNLIIRTRSGELRQQPPLAFQTIHGKRRFVHARYILIAPDQVGYKLDHYNPTQPLTIDPLLVYQRYFGGSGSDTGGPVATDAQGNVYVTGKSNSVDFPGTNSKIRSQSPLTLLSNAGKSVTSLPLGTPETSVTSLAATPDGKVIYVGTPDGVLLSTDGGSTFTPAAPLPNAGGIGSIAIDPADPSRALVATVSGLFLLTSNGQAAVESDQGISPDISSPNVSKVQFDSANHQIVFALSRNLLYKSTDGGSSWQQIGPGSPILFFALSPDGNTLYVATASATLFKSTDAGASFQRIGGQLPQLFSLNVDPLTPSTLYIGTVSGLQVSTDGGATFTTISSTSGSQFSPITAVTRDASGALYITTVAGQLFISPDQGATFSAPSPNLTPNTIVAAGGQVLVGTNTPSVQFLVKWNRDGSQMLFSTFFGGTQNDSVTAIAIDQQGEAVVAGYTTSSDFPVTGNLGAAASPNSASSGFVTKLSADGSSIIYSTLISASQSVAVNALALDATGALYIAGSTSARDFPTTPDVPQPKSPAAACQGTSQPTFGFVSKLSPNATTLVYSTYLTGACGSSGGGIAVNAALEAVVVGYTYAPDFPTTPGSYQPTFPGGPQAVVYPYPLTAGFVTKLSAAGDQILNSSFIGGEQRTTSNAVALDSNGGVYVTGSTYGIAPGPTPGAFQSTIRTGCDTASPAPFGGPSLTGGSDAYYLKLNPALTTAQALTYLGDSCGDSGLNLLLDSFGNVWIGGYSEPPTFRRGFPLVTPYMLPRVQNNFVSEFSADGSRLLFSSYSDGPYLAQDPAGPIYVSGSGQPISGLHKNNSLNPAASLAKIDPASNPAVVIDSVTPGQPNQTQQTSQFVTGYLASGELITISGHNLGPASLVLAQLDAQCRLSFAVNSVSVTFNGVPAPLISVQESQIVCFIPFAIAGPADIVVTNNGQSSMPTRVAVLPSFPDILVVANEDGSLNSPTNPAKRGSTLTVYVTGFGLTSPASQDGAVNGTPLPVPQVAIQTMIGGITVQPEFLGAAPDLVAGITQLNVPVPQSLDPTQPQTTLLINTAIAKVSIQ